MPLFQCLKDRRGNTSLVFGLAAIPLFGAAIGSLDMGLAYYEQAILQDAADAGALAGAGRLSMLSLGRA